MARLAAATPGTWLATSNAPLLIDMSLLRPFIFNIHRLSVSEDTQSWSSSFTLFYCNRSLSYTYSTICSRQSLWHIHSCTFCSRWYCCDLTVKWPFESVIRWRQQVVWPRELGVKVATAKHMHGHVRYSTRGGGGATHPGTNTWRVEVLFSAETLVLCWHTLQQWLLWSRKPVRIQPCFDSYYFFYLHNVNGSTTVNLKGCPLRACVPVVVWTESVEGSCSTVRNSLTLRPTLTFQWE